MAEDGIANGTISVTVPNWEAFNDDEGKPTKSIVSTVQKIGGLAWQMKVRKALNPPGLYLTIYGNVHVKARLWLCKARFEVKVSGLLCTFACPNDKFYGFNSHFWNYNFTQPTVEHITKLLAEGPVEINLKLNIGTLIENFPPLDTSLVLNMGKRSETLFVNKCALAAFSSYFRNLFFGDWRDKQEHDGNKFELNAEPEDFDLRAFKAMIYANMTLGGFVLKWRFLDYKLACEIIKLAIKYDFPMMLDCCEKFLIGVKEKSSAQKLELLKLADQFSLLIRLKEHCLNEMSVLDFVENFAKGTEMHLSKATEERLRGKLGGKAEESRETVEELKAGVSEERVKKLINAIEG